MGLYVIYIKFGLFMSTIQAIKPDLLRLQASMLNRKWNSYIIVREPNGNPCTKKVYSWSLYGCKGNYMVYLKQLNSRLDRLAKRQAVHFLRKPNRNMWKYYFSKSQIFLSKKTRTEKYWAYIILRHLCRPKKQCWSFKNTAYWFLKHLD